MGLNYNNSVDQDLTPNQASPGRNYSAPADGAPGNTTILRKGVVTRLDLTGGLTASRILRFGSVLSQGWLLGDTVFVQLPTHTGIGFTVTVEDIAGNPIALWQELSANGGMFVFGASQLSPTDFGAVIPGSGASSLGPAAAAQATWFIDGQNVTGKASDSNDGLTAITPLLTDQERARRIGNLTVRIVMTVNLLSSLQATDFITEPQVGNAACFIVTGSPGATTLHTGTLTGAAVQAGNNPATVTDAATVWAAFVGQRLRVTGGARAGAIAWLLHDNGAHVAVCSDPEIEATNPSQISLVSVSLAAPDPYVIESLPMVPAVVSPYGWEDGAPTGVGPFCRFMYEGIQFPSTTYVVRTTEDFFARQFIGCMMGSINATATFMACSWVMPAFFSLEFSPGIECVLLGCGLLFTAATGLDIASGCSTTLDQGTVVYGSPVVVSGWLGIGIFAAGAYEGLTAGVVSSSSDGVIVAPGGTLRADNLLWGAGNAAYGIRVQSCGQGVYITKPTITGTTNDTIVGGVAHAYAAIPVVTAANNAALVALT